MKTYNYGKHSIDDDDIKAVVSSLQSGWLTQGPEVSNFEDNLKNKFGAAEAIAVSNGTAGLHLIGAALNWGPKDTVLTSPLTFLASANCILYAGAQPGFVDIDPKTYTLCPQKLEDKLIQLSKKNTKVQAVVAVDFAGHPCDWDSLVSLSKKYEFDLIDDACHAIGAKYKGQEVCSSKFAKAVNLSFHPVKSMTTGEGGAVLTNSTELSQKIKMLRTHGMTKDPSKMEKNDGPWYYEMHELGFNYRITDFQAALGSSQLKKLNCFNKRRREIAQFYNKHLNSDLLLTPFESPDVEHAYHLYAVQLKLDKISVDRKNVFLKLKDMGLNLQVHYYPVHLQPFYKKKFGFKRGDFSISESVYDRELSLPVYPDLSDEDLRYICDTINSTLKEVSL